MSYCRMGADSDVYIIANVGIICMGCKLSKPNAYGSTDYVAKRARHMLVHLRRHVKNRHKVPQRAIDRLTHEMRIGK